MIKTINFIFEINDKHYRIDGFNLFRLSVCLEQISFRVYEPNYEPAITEIVYLGDYRSISLINLSVRFLKALWAYFKVDREMKTIKELLEENFDFFEEDF